MGLFVRESLLEVFLHLCKGTSTDKRVRSDIALLLKLNQALYIVVKSKHA